MARGILATCEGKASERVLKFHCHFLIRLLVPSLPNLQRFPKQAKLQAASPKQPAPNFFSIWYRPFATVDGGFEPESSLAWKKAVLGGGFRSYAPPRPAIRGSRFVIANPCEPNPAAGHFPKCPFQAFSLQQLVKLTDPSGPSGLLGLATHGLCAAFRPPSFSASTSSFRALQIFFQAHCNECDLILRTCQCLSELKVLWKSFKVPHLVALGLETLTLIERLARFEAT